MLRVYFVEDEAMVRRAIIDTVNWEKADIEVCGQADNGEIALPEILALKPDVLITDIKMPFMDGLELSRLVKHDLPDTLVMILSGYGEFDFTHRAIHVGVFDYILKPVTPEKLLQALNRAAQYLKVRNQNGGAAGRDDEKTEAERLLEGSVEEIERVIDRPEICRFVKTASREDIAQFSAKTADQIWNAAQHSRLFFLCCMYDLLATAGDAATDMGIAPPAMKSFLQPGDAARDKQELEEQLCAYFQRLFSARDEMADSKSQLINRAKAYIEQEHSNAELSLGAVAAHVGVTQNYLSMLINRETGENFSECLNKIRIQHAMELLKSSADPLAVIAQKVGFNDQYYLSKIFKKMLGVSPREFKKM